MNDRILIIDDESDIATLVAKVARKCGYEAVATSSIDEFREKHANWNPTVIVLDLHMPGTDGIELIRFLATEKSAARILIMSGFDIRVLQSAQRLGTERGLDMAGTLTKPVRVAELQERLNGMKIAGGDGGDDKPAK